MTTRAISASARALTAPALNAGAQLRTQQGSEVAWDERVFPSGEERSAQISFLMPPAWDGSAVSFTFRMRAAAIVGSCIWELHYIIIPTGVDRGTISPVQADVQKVIGVPGTTLQEFEVSFAFTPGAVPGQLVLFRLRRRGSLPGDDTGDVSLLDWWYQLEDTSGGGGGGGGEANTASNLGAGEGIWSTKAGVDLRFKSLVAGAGIGLSSDPNSITIDAGTSGFTDVATDPKVLTVLEAFGNHIIADSDTVGADLNITLPTPGATEHGKRFSIQRVGAFNVFITVPIAFVIAGGTPSPIPLPVNGDMLEFLYRHTPTPTYYIF